MADEDALKELKERLAKTDIGMAGGARKTRSSAKPLDAAPDTFMGASVGAKAVLAIIFCRMITKFVVLGGD